MNVKMIKRLERVFKGVANANRLRILDYISSANSTSVWAISQILNINFANTSQHLQKLEKAGLINKHHSRLEVYHELTPFGVIMLETIKKLS